MPKTISLILIYLSCCTLLHSQDTIRLDSLYSYSSIDFPNKRKSFYAKLNYAKEVIHYNDTIKKVNFCYKYDNEKHCKEFEYRLSEDSIVLIKSTFQQESWIYRENSPSIYSLSRKDSICIEKGSALSILPLIKTGVFITKSFSGDTLWYSDFTNFEYSNPNAMPTIEFHKERFVGKIYNYEDLDKHPMTMDSCQLNYLKIPRVYNSSGDNRKINYFCSFTVTEKGKILNITSNKTDPRDIKNLIRSLKTLEPLIPAQINNTKVNCKWIILLTHENSIVNFDYLNDIRTFDPKLEK